MEKELNIRCFLFLLTPLREGRPIAVLFSLEIDLFLLTPLREGRPDHDNARRAYRHISTHAPAGGATPVLRGSFVMYIAFLLTPLREGRQQFSTSPS